MQRRAAQAGLPGDLVWPEVVADLGRGGSGAAAVACEDIGRDLFLLVARARELGCDPETEPRAAARRYRDQVLV